MRKLQGLLDKQKGTSLIELMIAMLVLTVGLVGTVAVITTSIRSNTRSRHDSTSASLAEMVADQISAIPLAAGTTSITVNDCGGNAWTVNTSGTSAGAGATLTSSNTIDFTQTYSAVTAGYKMQYVVCGTASAVNVSYDVRWNIKTLPSTTQQCVVVGVRPVISNSTSNAAMWALPVNVRTLVGNDGN